MALAGVAGCQRGAAEPPPSAGRAELPGVLSGRLWTESSVEGLRLPAVPGCRAGDGPGEVRPGPVPGALVRVLDPTPAPPPAVPRVLEERGCRLEPLVSGLVEGQGVLLRAADRERHAWTARRDGAVLFRVVQPAGAPAPAHEVPAGAGVVELSCDEHPGARAFLFVRPNAQFSSTDAQGRFELPPLDPGLHTVEAWHPLLQPVRRTVEVPAGGTAALELQLRAPAGR